MVRSYLKYEQSQSFGVVSSAASNAIWVEDREGTAATANATSRHTGAGIAVVGANEDVLSWNIKKGELIGRWQTKDSTAAVTCISRSLTDKDIFAVGYADGSIRLWDSRTATILINFNGHRSAVTKLCFDSQGTRLASGSRDTNIIVWDLVSEVGLFKLRGHKDQITGLHFLSPNQVTDNVDSVDGTSAAAPMNGDSESLFLLSTSKDALIKLWDVTSQYCIETHVTQSNGECWSMGISPDGTGCITGGNDGELRVWLIDTSTLLSRTGLTGSHDGKIIQDKGTFTRYGKDRTTDIVFHPKYNYLAAHGMEKAVELFRIRTSVEIQKSLSRKRKRKREKAASKGEVEDGDTMMDDLEADDSVVAGVEDTFVAYTIVRTGGKVRSMHWASSNNKKALRLMAGLTNNQVELYNVPIEEKAKEIDYDRILSVELPGHRTDIRAVSLSSDDRMLATASAGSLKVWNMRTQSCLRTLECGYALCSSFIPGDKIVVVGNKNGELQLFDIAASTLIDTVKAHEGAIWTLQVQPDGRSIVTGGADKCAKFWNFEVVQEEIPGTVRTTPKLKLVHTRTLKVNDDILNVCFSADGRLIALATLDNTVKVFFVDSLKLYLNLYGHKLPVLSMSISSDSKLITTCSADKNVRIWGLDFGDCHKAIFAHDESIMQVSFIPHPVSRDEAHIFFSASKDHNLKTWDGDRFQHIQKLSGHHGEIWAMVVSRTGDFLVTTSHDKSIRIWRQSDEPLFLEEERERELEEMYDKNLAESLEKDETDRLDAAGQDDEEGNVAPASKQTATTLTASEKITEALTMCTEDLETVREYEKQAAREPGAASAIPQRHPLLAMRKVSAERHLLSVFEAIPSPALHDALLLLSFSTLPSLFVFVSIWLQKEMNITLTCRVLLFLLKTHHTTIVASQQLRLLLEEMNPRLRSSLAKWKHIMGFNMVASELLVQRVKDSKAGRVEDEEEETSTKASGQKRAFVSIA